MATQSNTSSYAALPTNKITARNGIEYAYREVGTSPVPLLLLQHFRGNLDKLNISSSTIALCRWSWSLSANRTSVFGGE
jgi:hypothetical protein